jgi:hypothetical protein
MNPEIKATTIQLVKLTAVAGGIIDVAPNKTGMLIRRIHVCPGNAF